MADGSWALPDPYRFVVIALWTFGNGGDVRDWDRFNFIEIRLQYV